MANKSCFELSTFKEIDKLVNTRKLSNEETIIFVKNFIIKGFGVDWLKAIKKLIKNKHNNHKINFYVDSGYDYGLSIMLIRNNVKYIKLKSNKTIIKKINQIAKKNKVLLNPTFDIVKASKYKNISVNKKK